MPSFSDSIFLFVLALLLFGPKRLPVLARELGKWVGEFRRASNEFKMQMEEELRLVEQADRQKQIAAIEAAAPVPPSLDQPEHPHLPAAVAAEDSTSDPSADSSAYRSSENAESYDKSYDESADSYTGSADSYTESADSYTRNAESSTDWRDAPSPASHAGTSEDSNLADQSSPTRIDTPTPASETIDGVPVLPIATSGDLRMMPPSTGLPTPRQPAKPAARPAGNPLGGLLDAIPETSPQTSLQSSLQTSATPESRNIPELHDATPETAAHGH